MQILREYKETHERRKKKVNKNLAYVQKIPYLVNKHLTLGFEIILEESSTNFGGLHYVYLHCVCVAHTFVSTVQSKENWVFGVSNMRTNFQGFPIIMYVEKCMNCTLNEYTKLQQWNYPCSSWGSFTLLSGLQIFF